EPHELLQGPVGRAARQRAGVRGVPIIGMVGNFYASGGGNEVQDVPDARVVEAELRQNFVQLDERRWARLSCLFPQLCDIAARLRLVLVADAALDFDHFSGKLTIGGVEIAGASVFAKRLFELAARLRKLRLIEMCM